MNDGKVEINEVGGIGRERKKGGRKLSDYDVIGTARIRIELF